MLNARDASCQVGVVHGNMPPMRKRTLWVRTPVLLLTLLQLSVPAAAAWADALVGEWRGSAHIESHSTSACPRVHPSDCAFHRLLATPLAQAPATVARIRDGQGIRWTSRAIERSSTATGLTLPDSRAPPPLS